MTPEQRKQLEEMAKKWRDAYSSPGDFEEFGQQEAFYAGAQAAFELATKAHEDLLSEARDWLCSHQDAMDVWLKPERPGRVWCSSCCNYLRREEDVTLIARIDAILNPGPRSTE